MCSFQTSPCVGSQRLRVYRQNGRMLEHMRAFCQYTRMPFECTHGSVLNLNTGGLFLSPLLFLSFLLSLFLRSLSLHSSIPSALFPLLSALFSSLSITMTMITRPVGSLCTHGSCQSAWASVHSLVGDYVRIMQETTVLA